MQNFFPLLLWTKQLERVRKADGWWEILLETRWRPPSCKAQRLIFSRACYHFLTGFAKFSQFSLKKEEVHCIMFEIIKNISLEFLVYGMRLIQWFSNTMQESFKVFKISSLPCYFRLFVLFYITCSPPFARLNFSADQVNFLFSIHSTNWRIRVRMDHSITA